MNEKTIYQSSDLTKNEKKTRALRKWALREVLERIGTLFVNTGKDAKALAIIKLIVDLTGEELSLHDGVELVIDRHDEPAYKNADAVAIAKARRARFQVAIERGFLLPEDLYSAGDVNAFLSHSDQGFGQKHKLERKYDEVFQAQFVEIREQLIEQYCRPQNEQVRIIWDLATHIINGKEHTFSDDIEVISAPIDQELLDIYLFKAWDKGNKNGLIMKSNLQFAAMECLIENGKINSIAILSDELKRLGYGYKELRQYPTPDILAVALYSILTNKPPAMVGSAPELALE